MAHSAHASPGIDTILVVDDNPALLRSVERLLRLEGFNVMLAADGSEALHQLEVSPTIPDLIVSDVSMPRMDGFELFEQVRKRDEWLGIPFLFLTARDQIDDLRRGYSLGADDYLVKPLDQEKLLLVVRSKLKRKHELMTHIHSQQSALDTAKQELVAMVAHELRTPLVSISMVSDILFRELPKMEADQVQDMLDMMQSGSRRLTRLIEQMVLYVQLQSGALRDSIRHQSRPNYLREAVQGAIDDARQLNVRQPDVTLSYDEQDPQAMVVGDLTALRQALTELMLNAAAFSKPGETVRIVQWAEDGNAWVAVIDRGPGIPVGELEHVFEPFRQYNRRRYEQQGVGLGLALARGIFEAHGGGLELHSTVDQGTQAAVRLPLWTDPAD
jgi:signal transduction histidine kinase